MLMELAESMEAYGWEYTMMAAPNFGDDKKQAGSNIGAYLKDNAQKYDVIDYDYKFGYFQRKRIHRSTLLVARAQLLLHHYVYSPCPPLAVDPLVMQTLKYQVDKFRKWRTLPGLDRNLSEADLVSVLNRQAKHDLIKRGISSQKIVVLPNGMNSENRAGFRKISSDLPQDPLIAFIGMFGPRKGSIEMPKLVRLIRQAKPDARFRLLGTLGILKTKREVLERFDLVSRPQIEVVPSYDASELPGLLAECSLGFFPSYAEGFPLGVMEMLAASLPVVVYDVPGAPEMLPSEWLVPVKDYLSMARKITWWLDNPATLQEDRITARKNSEAFVWNEIAHKTDVIYSNALEARRDSRKID